MRSFLIKLRRLIKIQTGNILWMLFSYFPYRSNLCSLHSICKVRPHRWWHWHNGAQCFVGTSMRDGAAVFLKTDSIQNTLGNEYRMTSIFYAALPQSCPKPLSYISTDGSDTIAFEMIEGVTLAQLLDDSDVTKRINWDVLFGKLWLIIETLGDLSMIHRDLTPTNLLVRLGDDHKDLDLFVIDFAFAGMPSDGINDAYIDEGELAYLGLTFKPQVFTWDDAYSALKIIEYIGHKVDVDSEAVRKALSGRIGSLSYSHKTP